MIRSLLSQLAVLAAICSCVLIICPETALKKYVKLACSLCALSLILSFLPFHINDLESENVSVSVADLTEDAKRMITEQTAKRVCDAVYELAYTKYGMEKDGISVNVSYGEREDGVTELKKADIELYGIKYAVFTVPLKNSVSELLNIPCEVVIKE